MDRNPGSSASRRFVDNELVEVFDTNSDSEALVVKGLLDSAGIESVIISLDAPQEILPGVGGVVIRVTPEQAEEARHIIEEYRSSGDAGDDTGETTDDSAA